MLPAYTYGSHGLALALGQVGGYQNEVGLH